MVRTFWKTISISMEKIRFDVSSKTARLIGRENISGVNGALLELIKNGYDADASFCAIYFFIPFLSMGSSYDARIINKVLKQEDYDLFLECYQFNGDKTKFVLKEDTNDDVLAKLGELLNAYNKIVVLDNGTGMDESIIKNDWMNIGTDNKEKHFSSAKGRIKTGAKGIGRFAIDKLSKLTTMVSKKSDSNPVKWTINWNDFDTAAKLSEIHANLEIMERSFFSTFIKEEVPQDLYNKLIKKHGNIDNGTIIVLTPTREQWSTRLFNSLNTTLNSINPLQSADVFDVFIKNEFYEEYNFAPNGLGIDEKNYDYRVESTYDGENTVTIKIHRNEFDTSLEKINVLLDDNVENKKSIEIDSSLFWDREPFKNDFYCRNKYYAVQTKKISATDLLPNESLSEIKKIGSFTFDFYFLKLSNASGFDIVKKINQKARKQLLDNYSGIKIYRDNFKIRPYGDEGSNFFDWLMLAQRSQKSPAAITKTDARWRVEPYQIIGSLKITRLGNPMLRDMANREGLEPNDTYGILRDLLITMVDEFEFDRQFYYRQYALLRNELKKKYYPKSIEIYKKYSDKKTFGSKNKNENKYSKEEIEDALLYSIDENKRMTSKEELLMALGTSGILANTFSHELKALQTEFDINTDTVRRCIQNIVREEEYNGDEDLNPYTALKLKEYSDRLLSSWVGVLSNGIKNDSLNKSTINLIDSIKEIIDVWVPLLNTKKIKIDFDSQLEDAYVFMSKSDIYIVLNNFILNSAWFLEKVGNRKIRIKVFKDNNNIILQLENNGEELDGNYRNSNYKIFELGETSKYKIDKDTNEKIKVGTGIGLWMVKSVADINGATIFFHQLENPYSFGFSLSVPEDVVNNEQH